jgi:hypothetical protein
MVPNISEESMYCSGKIGRRLRCDALQIVLDAAKLVNDYSLYEGGFAWEMIIERLLAHAEFLGQIVHGDRTETVGQEVVSGSSNDPSPRGIVDVEFLLLLLDVLHREPLDAPPELTREAPQYPGNDSSIISFLTKARGILRYAFRLL